MTSVLALGINPVTSMFLRDQGFILSSDACFSAEELCDVVRRSEYKAILFGENVWHGEESVALLRRRNLSIPVIRIALGPRNEAWAHSAAAFLDSGGDDVIVGPSQPEEVAACLRAVLRRADGIPPNVLRYEKGGMSLVINQTMKRVWVNDSPLLLTGHEMEALLVIASCNGIISRKDICWELYGVERRGTNTIEVFVHRLRKKFGDAGVLLETIRGTGYELLGRAA